MAVAVDNTTSALGATWNALLYGHALRRRKHNGPDVVKRWRESSVSSAALRSNAPPTRPAGASKLGVLRLGEEVSERKRRVWPRRLNRFVVDCVLGSARPEQLTCVLSYTEPPCSDTYCYIDATQR